MEKDLLDKLGLSTPSTNTNTTIESSGILSNKSMPPDYMRTPLCFLLSLLLARRLGGALEGRIEPAANYAASTPCHFLMACPTLAVILAASFHIGEVAEHAA